MCPSFRKQLHPHPRITRLSDNDGVVVHNLLAPTGAEERKGHGSDDNSFSDSDDHSEDEEEHGWFLALLLTSCSRKCIVHPLVSPLWSLALIFVGDFPLCSQVMAMACLATPLVTWW